MLGWLLKRKFPFPFTKRDFIIHRPSFANIFKVGIPLWLQEMLVTVSFMIITGIVNDMGVVAGASVGIVARIFSFAGTFALAIGNAVAAMVAQNIGAGKRDRALKSLRWGITYSLIIDTVIMIICQIIPLSITTLLAKKSPDTALGAAAYLRSFSLDMVLIAFIFSINAYLSGCGKSFVSMAHSLIATFLVRVPLSFVFTRVVGATVTQRLLYLGFAAPIASILSLVICFSYLAWQNRVFRRADGRLPEHVD
jgi:Na+-driven multidrug efflux pump